MTIAKFYYIASMITVFITGANTGINIRALIGMDKGLNGSVMGTIILMIFAATFSYIGWIIKDRK